MNYCSFPARLQSTVMKKTFLLLSIFSTCISVMGQHALDSSFGNNGIVHTYFPPTENVSVSLAQQVIAHPDGSYFLRTANNVLAHRLANGAIDLNYGENGYSAPFVSGGRAGLLPNGKIVIGGTTYSNGAYDFLFVCMNADGTLDKTFAQRGKQIIDFAGVDQLNDIAISTEGKIVAVGSYNNNSGCAIARLNIDGTLDNSFSTDGKQTSINIIGPSAVAISNADRIIVTGSSQGKAAVAAYLPNGEPDYSFGVNGVSTPPGMQTAKRIAIQADGKIVLAAQSSLFRLNTNGTLDNNFSGDGIQIIDSSLMDGLEDMVIDSQGGILVAGGKIINGRYLSRIARFTSAGVLDRSFADDGSRTIDLQVFATYPYSLAIQNDGRILVAGVHVISGNNSLKYFAARLNADGSLDNSMGDDGIIIDYMNVGLTFFNASVVQPDGKIVCAGFARTQANEVDFLVARFNANGWLDTTFSHDGFVTIRFETVPYYTDYFTSLANAVALQPDGKIVVAGYSVTVTSAGVGNSNYALARLNADGSMDNSFSEDGKLTTDLFGGDDYAYSVAIQPDGKIVAAGSSAHPEDPDNSDFSLVRYNADGTLDNSFSLDGKQSTDFSTLYDRALKVLIQPDGKILLAGEAGWGLDFGLARYRADGSPDDQFGSGGVTSIDFQGGSDAASDAVLLSDGKFLVSGTSAGHFAVAKLQPNGFLDSSFAVHGEKVVNLGYYMEGCKGMAIQSNGSIVLGGSVNDTSKSAKSDIAMVRLFPDGTIDNSFSFDDPSFADLPPQGKSIASINIHNGELYAVGTGTYIDRVGFILAVKLDCSLKLSIPNAFALPVGVEPNTVYKGYAPAEDITLTAVANGKFPFTYLWSTGATTKYIRVRPNTTTTYDVTVTDASGCSQKVSKTVNFVDVRCGNKNEKVLLCERESCKWPKRKTVCVDPWMATLLLWKGSHFGTCPSDGLSSANPSSIGEETNTFGLTASPNPTYDQFALDIKLNQLTQAQLIITDMQGRVIEKRLINSSSLIRTGANYQPGIYMVELTQGESKQVIKVVKVAR